jgi:hypothetical protein
MMHSLCSRSFWSCEPSAAGFDVPGYAAFTQPEFYSSEAADKFNPTAAWLMLRDGKLITEMWAAFVSRIDKAKSATRQNSHTASAVHHGRRGSRSEQSIRVFLPK